MTSSLSHSTTRRSLLQTAALTAGGLIAAQPAEPVRVAVVGVGNRGSFLLSKLLRLPDVAIVAICDVNPAALAAAGNAAEEAGQHPARFSDFRRIADTGNSIQAVVMAVPDPLHKDMYIAVLEMGKHLYGEKPLSLSVADGRMVVEAAAHAQGIFQSGFQLRYDPARGAAVRFVQNGGIGRVLFMQGARHGRDIPRQLSWYFDRDKSGDIIVDQGIHMLDLFTWIAGQPPLRAAGFGGINLFHDQPKGRTIMDNYAAIFEYPGGIRLSFSHHYFDPVGFSGTTERIWGSEGSVDLPDARWATREGPPGEPIAIPEKGADSTALSLMDFVRNVRRNNRTPLNNAESALQSLRVALLGRRAIELGRVVSWDEVV